MDFWGRHSRVFNKKILGWPKISFEFFCYILWKNSTKLMANPNNLAQVIENWLCCRPFAGACVLSRFSHVQLFASLWPIACQAPLSMGFSRQDYWSGLPYAPAGDLSDPGIEPISVMSPVLSGGFFTTSVTLAAPII